MNEFDKCKFCCSYDNEHGCEDTLCYNHYHYRIDVNKIIAKSDELGITVTDVLNLMREVNG